MNPLALLYKSSRAKIASIELDATLTEQHDADVEVTEHPVERGADIADHIRPKPETVTIEGIISNRPIGGTGSAGNIPIVGGFLTENDKRAEVAYTKLRELKDKAETLTLTTASRVYTNMVMTSLKRPVDSKLGGSLKFTATFKRIHIVETATVALERFARAVHASKHNGGPQSGTVLGPENQKKSWAKQLVAKSEETIGNLGNAVKKWGGK